MTLFVVATIISAIVLGYFFLPEGALGQTVLRLEPYIVSTWWATYMAVVVAFVLWLLP